MTVEGLEKIEIPLALFENEEVSFTFLDSMYSLNLEEKKPVEFYQKRYHGKVFTLCEIDHIISEKGEPTEGWWGSLPEDFFPYVEAQVWNHTKLLEFYNSLQQS